MGVEDEENREEPGQSSHEFSEKQKQIFRAVADGAEQGDGGYEFSMKENLTLRAVAGPMGFVGKFSILAGVLYLLLTLLTATTSQSPLIILLSGGVGAMYIFLGFCFTKAATSFRAVATTEGQDIRHLMGALTQLGKAFELIRVVLLLSLIVWAGAMLMLFSFLRG